MAMIQITFTPGNAAQAELIGKLMAQYLSLDAPTTEAAQAVETSAPEAPAKKPRAQKSAAATPAEQPQAGSTIDQPASTATPATSSPADEGNAPAVTSGEPSPSASTASSEVSGKQWSLEEVRAKLAELSKGGKQQQVVALIASVGAKKLTDVPADKYGQLMAEAEAL